MKSSAYHPYVPSVDTTPKMDYALILQENLESPSPIPWFFKNLKPS